MRSTKLARYWAYIGELSIDNNVSERCLMTLIASCKENRVEPWAYLCDVLTRLPQGSSLDSLLPDAWLDAHPKHR